MIKIKSVVRDLAAFFALFIDFSTGLVVIISLII